MSGEMWAAGSPEPGPAGSRHAASDAASKAWHGVATVLLGRCGTPSWETAWLLLEQSRAGLLVEPMASEVRAVRVHAAVVSAAAELEFASLRRPRPPAPGPAAGNGPVGWADLRAILEAAVEVLHACVRTAPDPSVTARAVMYVRDALAAIDDS